MTASADDVFPDDMSLEDLTRAKKDFGTDDKLVQALSYIEKNIPIQGISSLIGPDHLINCLIPLTKNENPNVVIAAVRTIAAIQGLFAPKTNNKPKKVVFEEE